MEQYQQHGVSVGKRLNSVEDEKSSKRDAEEQLADEDTLEDFKYLPSYCINSSISVDVISDIL